MDWVPLTTGIYRRSTGPNFVPTSHES
jgi:hypothetical protein